MEANRRHVDHAASGTAQRSEVRNRGDARNGDTGTPVDGSVLGADLATIRSRGGDVIPSPGGYAADNGGTEIADSRTDVGAVAAADRPVRLADRPVRAVMRAVPPPEARHRAHAERPGAGPDAYLGLSGGGGGARAGAWTPASSWSKKLTVPFAPGASGTATVYVHGWYGRGGVYADDLAVS
ncbi:hypothetical protein [Streptomyces sp. NPDC096012]|uniref:hypothetical protein n=1 Tax=Streptomyces sp. NPDC096012 TaxID=3155684 RepID=UPI00336A2565